jgi:hypothetical protein
MLTHAKLHEDSRFAGTVQRYHTWPTLKPQSIAEHSWQVMRIYWHIWGEMPPNISTYLLWHDAGEIQGGDSPFAGKRRSTDLKHALDTLEQISLIEMGGPTRFGLCHKEKIRCKLCDLIEMLEYGLVERAMGNLWGLPIINVTAEAINRLMANLQAPDWMKVNRYLDRICAACHQYGIHSKMLEQRAGPSPHPTEGAK